jgi:hypothetical protein
MRSLAIRRTHPNVVSINAGTEAWDKDGNLVTLDESKILKEITKLKAAQPLRILRIERDRLLAESDWWASSDLTMSAKRKSYRQALRDLPANTSPSLDESGQLTGVTWPTKPA